MALRTPPPTQFPDLVTRVQTENIIAASRLVSHLTGFVVQAEQGDLGANAFAHESGIHQDGSSRTRLTYEIMTPRRSACPQPADDRKLSGPEGAAQEAGRPGYELGERPRRRLRAAIARPTPRRRSPTPT